MSEKRILFTGGGTAGHVIVNLALIPIFKEEGWTIDYIGSYDGIERELIENLPYVSYHPISTGKLRRYLSVENLKDPFKVMKGTMQAWKIIGKIKPHVVFSKGGFVSVPVVVAAKLRGIPTIIHESDYTPGLANKLSIPFAQKVLTTFPETVKFMPQQKVEHVGAVIREEIFQGSKEDGFRLTEFTKEKPVLLVMGGSAGSEKINEIIRKSLKNLLEEFQIIHICGKGNIDHSYKQKGYVQYEYVHDELKDLFAMTDIVISRAGSNAIFEFLALRMPMLLIPLSLRASRGDQIDNAKSFERSGYAQVLEEENLSQITLLEEIFRLKEYRSIFLDKMESYESREARDRVKEIIYEIANLSLVNK